MKVRTKYCLFTAVVWVPSLALALASYMLVLKPQVQHSKELDVQLTDVKNLYRVARYAAEEKNRVELEQTVQKLNDRVSDFSMQTSATADLAFELAKLADETGVEAFAMKPTRKQGLEAIDNCDLIGRDYIELNFNGPFHEFATLLNALERHHPTLFVETFSIHRGRSQESEPKASIQLAVLVEKPQES